MSDVADTRRLEPNLGSKHARASAELLRISLCARRAGSTV